MYKKLFVTSMKLLAVIPARSGSKGLIDKNLQRVGGLTLVERAILCAKGIDEIKRIVVSTDSKTINKIAAELGSSFGELRPSHLAGDDTKIIDVLRYILGNPDIRSEDYDGIVLLQPTSPLREKADVKECIKIFKERNASSVVSVRIVPHNFIPEAVMRINDSGWLQGYSDHELTSRTQRQEKPIYYARNGPAVLITSVACLINGSLYGTNSVPYIMSERKSIDIDSQIDLAEARRLFNGPNDK